MSEDKTLTCPHCGELFSFDITHRCKDGLCEIKCTSPSSINWADKRREELRGEMLRLQREWRLA